MVNNLLTGAGHTGDTQVRSLGREDPLEKGTASHSSTLAWRGPGPGSLAGCSSPGGTHSDSWARAQAPILSGRVEALVAQLSSPLCDPMDCSPPGSCVPEILQGRTLEWVAIPYSRGSSQPRDQTWVSCSVGTFFTI